MTVIQQPFDLPPGYIHFARLFLSTRTAMTLFGRTGRFVA